MSSNFVTCPTLQEALEKARESRGKDKVETEAVILVLAPGHIHMLSEKLTLS